MDEKMNDFESGASIRRELSRINIPKVRKKSIGGKWRKGLFPPYTSYFSLIDLVLIMCCLGQLGLL